MHRTLLLFLLLLAVVTQGTVVCRTQAGLTRLLYLACADDPFCTDQYAGLKLAPPPDSTTTAATPDNLQHRPLQGLIVDSEALGFQSPAAIVPHEQLTHIDAAVWGAGGPPAGGLFRVNANDPAALNCAHLAPPYAPDVALTLRLASATIVRYRQAVAMGPQCSDSMHVRVYSPVAQTFTCVCRQGHDCEQPKYEVALLTFLFQFDVILVIAAAAFLGMSTHDLLRKQKA